MSLRALVDMILPGCEPFPGINAVIVMDNALVHVQAPIEEVCAAVGVIVLFLPPYGYSLDPVELCINSGRKWLQIEYGSVVNPLIVLLASCSLNAVF